MNERIKELSEMSGFHFDEYNEATARKIATLGALIVRDSIRVLYNNGIGTSLHDQLVRQECCTEIKQHFGVNE